MDRVVFFELLSGGTTSEASLCVTRSDKGDLMVGILHPEYSSGTGPIRGIEVPRNEWFCLELVLVHSTAASELRVHIGSSQVTATGINWAASLTNFRLGSVSGTLDVRGIMYFDSIIFDDDRMVAPQPLDPANLDNEVVTLTKTGYVFVGAGTVECLDPRAYDRVRPSSLIRHRSPAICPSRSAYGGKGSCGRNHRDQRAARVQPRLLCSDEYPDGWPTSDRSPDRDRAARPGDRYGWGGFGEEGYAA